MLTTEGTLLGGRVHYRQPAQGFRSGIEPVLLAAAVPAQPGERVLEAGTGAGPALLCLSARVPGCAVTGAEIDPELAVIAAENATANGFSNARATPGDIVNTTFPEPFDHAMANPPYHSPASSPSKDPVRRLAKVGSESLIETWIARMAAGLRRHGTLTLIVAAGMAPGCIAAMAAARCRCTVLFPLWPKPGVA
ncbi:MAG TPA: methyltransferase, partial [Rhodopila sp.]|nr:methyltransferase [Rhodopila sp.]